MRKLFTFLIAAIFSIAVSGSSFGGCCTLGVFGPSAAAGCTQATNFITRANAITTLDATHQTAYTTLICGMVTDGTFAKLDALYMLATDTQAHSALSLISATYNGTYSGMIFTANQGIVYNGGVANFDSAFNPTTAVSPKFTQNSASFGIWDNAAGAGDGNSILQLNSSGDRLFPVLSGTTTLGNLNGSNNITGSTTVAAALYHVNVSASNAEQVYRNGVSIGTSSSATSLVANTDYVLGNSATSTDPVLAFWIGGSLSSTDAANMYARLHAYLQTIAGIP
jgi:hypothetical protein